MPGTQRAVRLDFRLISYETIREGGDQTHSRETKALVTVIVYSITLGKKNPKGQLKVLLENCPMKIADNDKCSN